jgi:hypothetical protein
MDNSQSKIFNAHHICYKSYLCFMMVIQISSDKETAMSKDHKKKEDHKKDHKKDQKQSADARRSELAKISQLAKEHDAEDTPNFGSMKDDFEPLKIVKLKHSEHEEPLEAEIVAEVEMNGKLYGLVTPAAPVVYILEESNADDDDSELQQIAPEEFEPIRKQIQEALSEWGVQIQIRADEFVLVGDPPEEFYSESELFAVEEDEEEVEYMILTAVDNGNTTYLVTMPTEPVLYPVELKEDDVAIVLADDEMVELHDIFQNIIQGMMSDDQSDD